MPRNRQRAKERQAQRRAEREGDWRPRPDVPGEALARAEAEAGAPPSETGRSDTLLASRTPEPTAATLRAEPERREADLDSQATRPAEPDDHRRGRVASFLAAVVAELRRVQWPDRAALTTMTGIVLGFVLIAGGYLGLLDFVFSRVIRAIL